ncbi:hypothetical protein STENM223S_00526 [Streptomyces tendae]
MLRYHEHAFPLREGTADLPLPRLLDGQPYWPVWWRLARTEPNYRRFFSISELIGVRVEDPEVFEATHGTILRLLREGVIDGLRADHPYGLADPGAYLERLHRASGGRWTVVEKILADGERLPAAWPVAGMTATTPAACSLWGSSRILPGTGNCSTSTTGSPSRRRTWAGTGRPRCGTPRTRCSRTSWPPRRAG